MPEVFNFPTSLIICMPHAYATYSSMGIIAACCIYRSCIFSSSELAGKNMSLFVESSQLVLPTGETRKC
eukprot:scaffold14122_cov87-Skeletonema_dohrnii-CCMP3373.AAC.3